MNIIEISNILQSGVELVGNLVKDSAEIKAEQVRYDLEAQKRKDEMVLNVVDATVNTGLRIAETVVNTIANNQEKKAEDNSRIIDTDLEIKKNEADEDIFQKRKKFDIEMKELEKDRDLQRRKDVLQAIQSYQIEVTNAVNQSMLILGSMPIDLKKKADEMLYDEQKKYAELQEIWMNGALERMERIDKSFANNEKMKEKLQEAVWDNVQKMIQLATETVERMNEDVKKINENALNFSEEGKEMVKRSFLSMQQLNGNTRYYIESEESE